MFTGIVEEVGRLKSLDGPLESDGARGITIEAKKVMDGLKLGDSIAINGACLTVVGLDNGSFSVDLAPETLRRTNLGSMEAGCGVNLERPLAITDRLGGHFVQGHVDATGEVISTRPEGDCMLMGFRAPEKLMLYIVEKSFVGVDGISLTVVQKRAASFSVSVIPYTLNCTVLKDRRVGDLVNLEADILAKYVESLLQSR